MSVEIEGSNGCFTPDQWGNSPVREYGLPSKEVLTAIKQAAREFVDLCKLHNIPSLAAAQVEFVDGGKSFSHVLEAEMISMELLAPSTLTATAILAGDPNPVGLTVAVLQAHLHRTAN